MRNAMIKLAMITGFSFFVACGQSDFAGFKSDSMKSDASKEDSIGIVEGGKKDTGTSKDEPAVSPEDITGAYLVCIKVLKEKNDGKEKNYGCMMMAKNQTKFRGAIDSWNVEVISKKDQLVYKPEIQLVPLKDPFHIKFSVPAEYSESDYDIVINATIQGQEKVKRVVERNQEVKKEEAPSSSNPVRSELSQIYCSAQKCLENSSDEHCSTEEFITKLSTVNVPYEKTTLAAALIQLVEELKKSVKSFDSENEKNASELPSAITREMTSQVMATLTEAFELMLEDGEAPQCEITKAPEQTL